MKNILHIHSNYKKLSQRFFTISLSLILGLSFTFNAAALEFSLNEVQVVVTPDSHLITWKDVQKFGIDVQVTASQLNSLELCNSSNCIQEALDAGAAYQKTFNVSGYEEVIVYYDGAGQVVASASEQTPPPSQSPPPPSTGGNDPAFPGNLNIGALVASIPGEFSVSSNGAATYSIPIVVPPGTSGVEPKLSFNYSSQSRNGLMGLGWMIGGLSVIHRCPANLAKDNFIDGVDFDNNDRFCLDGQPLIAINGHTYGAHEAEYQTEINNFSKIISYGNTGKGPEKFKVWTKSGEVLEYGYSNDSRINPPNANGGPQNNAICWLLNEVKDTVGNYMTVTYFENVNTGENYPERINYTSNGSLSTNNTVEFSYEDRNDVGSRYLAGLQIDSTKRLSNVATKNNGVTVTDYHISYNESPSTGRSQVDAITQCDANNDCVPYTSFNWEKETNPTFQSTPALAPPFPNVHRIVTGSNVTFKDIGTRFVELNGDGLLDVVYHVNYYGTASKGAYLNMGDSWQAAPQFTSPFPLIQYQTNYNTGGDYYEDLGSQFVDLNGDGLADFVYNQWNAYNNTQGPRGAYLNTGNGWVSAPQYNVPTPLMEYDGLSFQAPGVEFVDLNADGLLDFTYYHRSGIHGGVVRGAYLNSGSGWSYSAAYLPPLEISVHGVDGGYYYSKTSVRYIDLNGDTLPDFVSSYLSGSTLLAKTYINTGSGWSLSPDYALPKHLTKVENIAHQSSGAKLTDLNGDGLPDFVFSVFNGSSYDRGAWLNTGKGWEQDNRFEPPIYLGRSYFSALSDSGAKFVDLNSDGLQDCAYSFYLGGTIYKGAWLNTGSGWQSTPQLAPPYYTAHSASSNGVFTSTGAQFLDLNGDGLVEFSYSQANTWNQTSITKGAYVNTGVIEYVSNITNGLEVEIDISQTSILNSDVYQHTACIGSQCNPVVDLNAPIQVVEEVRTDNGIGGQNTLTYKYEGAKVHVQGRGLLGFSKRTVVDVDTNISNGTKYLQDFPFIGLVDESITCINASEIDFDKSNECVSGTKLSQQTVDFGFKGNGSAGPASPFVEQSVRKTFDLDNGALVSTQTVDNIYDNYGNPTKISVTTNDAALSGLYQTISENTYSSANFELGGIYPSGTTGKDLGRLTFAKVTKKAPGKPNSIRESEFTYYTTHGLLKDEIIEPNQSAFRLTKTYEYDVFGNRKKVTEDGADIAARDTQTQYDGKGQFPVTVTNAVGHVEQHTSYDVYGNIKTLIGPNGISTNWQYDTLGRNKKTLLADGTETNTTYEFCSATTCPSEISSVVSYKVTTTEIQSSNSQQISPTITQYYDKVNRVVLSESQNFNGLTVRVLSEFDVEGRLHKQSNPYFTGELASAAKTTYSYDELGRVTSVNSPATGFSEYDYNGIDVTTTQHRDNKDGSPVQLLITKQRTNTLEQTIWTEDVNSNKLHFVYSAEGNLLETYNDVDPTNTKITNVYNQRGFKISMSDPDMGNWEYDYTVLGELKYQKDGNNDEVTLTYDKLGRLETRVDHKESLNTPTRWIYDICIKGKGKLCSEEHYNGFTRNYFYDNKGRLIKTTTNILGTNYDILTSYDPKGRVDDITYPSGFKVENVYNAFGYLQNVRDANNTSNTFYTALVGDEFGNITSEGYGNGLFTTRSYQPSSGRIDSINTGLAGGTAIQDLQYKFDSLGNLKQRQDLDQSGLTEDFSYDTLNRLKTVNISTAGLLTYEYDDIGNIDVKPDLGYLTYDPSSKPHAVRSYSATFGGTAITTYNYDGNGNQTSGDGRTVTWSSFNKPIDIQKGNSSSTFKYGPDRARYQHVKDDGSNVTTTRYIGGLYEEVVTGTAVEKKHFIVAGGRTIAIYTDRNFGNDEIEYLHRDHLGSIDAITREDGSIKDKLSYDAFGKRRLSNWNNGVPNLNSNNTRGFTGHEMLDNVGLIHMNGRVYDPNLGRFISADPTLQFPTNMQNYNRYSYVNNNPLSFTDPSGFSIFDSIGDFFGDVADAVGDVFEAVGDALSNPVVQAIITFATIIACQGVCAPFVGAAEGFNLTSLVQVAGQVAQIATTAGNFVGGLSDDRAQVSGGGGGSSDAPLHGNVGDGPVTGAGSVASGASTAADIIIAASNAGTGDGEFANGAKDTEGFEYLLGYPIPRSEITRTPTTRDGLLSEKVVRTVEREEIVRIDINAPIPQNYRLEPSAGLPSLNSRRGGSPLGVDLVADINTLDAEIVIYRKYDVVTINRQFRRYAIARSNLVESGFIRFNYLVELEPIVTRTFVGTFYSADGYISGEVVGSTGLPLDPSP